MPEFDQARLDGDITSLIDGGFSEDEIVSYVNEHKDSYRLEVSPPDLAPNKLLKAETARASTKNLFEVAARITETPELKFAEAVGEQLGAVFDPVGGTKRILKNIVIGHKKATSGFFYPTLANLAGIAANRMDELNALFDPDGVITPSFSILREAQKAAEEAARVTTPTPLELEAQNTFLDKLIQGAGGAPVVVATFATATSITKDPVTGFAAVEALLEADKGPAATVRGAVRGALLGGILRTFEPLRAGVQAVGVGITFATQAALEGGGIDDIATSFLLGAGLVGVSGKSGGLTLKEASRLAVEQTPALARMANRRAVAEQLELKAHQTAVKIDQAVKGVIDEKFQENVLRVESEKGPPTQAEVNVAVRDAVLSEKVIRLEGKSPLQEKITDFEIKLRQGEMSEAQIMLSDAKDALNKNPESVELQAIESHMLKRFKELDAAKKARVPGTEDLILEGGESVDAFLKRVEPTPPIQKTPAKVTVRAKDRVATDKQIAKVHSMAEELGVTPDELNARLQKQFNANIDQLSGRQIGGLIGEFRRRIGTDKKPRPVRVKDTRVVTVTTEKNARIATRRLTEEGTVGLLDILEAKDRAKIPTTREVEYRSDKSFVSQKKAQRYLAELHKIADVNRISKQPRIKVDDSFMGGTYNRVHTKQSASVGLAREPRSAESMRYYMEGMGVRAGEPLGYLFDDLSILNRTLVRDQHNRYERLAHAAGSEKEFKRIAQSEESLDAIGRWLASKTNLKNKPAEPTLSPTELAFAEEFQRIMKDFEVTVRLAKLNKRIFEGHISKEFRNNLDSRRQILEAEEVFHREGLEALKKKLKTQTWGTIAGGGFEPMEMIDSFFSGGTRKFTGISEAHIRERGSVYTKQERNLMQRFRSYSRQMDMLAHAKPKLEAMRGAVRKAQRSGHIKKAKQLGQAMRLYEDNLLGNRSIELWAEEAATRAYNQALTAILQADVSKPFRNLFQSAAFYPDKLDFFRPDNRALKPIEMEYLRTYVSQMRVWDEFFMTDFRFPKEIPIPGTDVRIPNVPFNALNTMADRANFYGWSDEIGRIQSFWAMLNRVERARLQMDATVKKGMAPDKAFDKIFWRKTRMGTMTPHQQKRLMEIWANDGPEAMQLYRARLLVEDIHFLYEQTNRAVVEQTAQGKTFLKLANFPRAYTERLITQANRMFTGEDFTTKFQGFKTTFGMTVPAMLVGEVFLKITGGDINPYDPLRILKWGPLGLIKDVVGLPFAVGADFATAIDPRVPKERQDQAFTRFTRGVARMPNMWLPFWRHIIGTLDAVTGTKDIDVLAVKKFREIIDNEYVVRGGSHAVDRSALQMAQRIFGGRGVDRAIKLADKEARRKEKVRKKAGRSSRGRGGTR